MKRITSDPLDRDRFPVDDWALVDTRYSPDDEGVTETTFAVGNGYLGMRGTLDEGRGGHSQGTYVTGFHETWPIRHAEDAFGFAQVGQTIVNVPDAKTVRLTVDDEPFVLADAELLACGRRLDFGDGVLTTELVWRTPSGKRVRVHSRRMVSFSDRHLAVIEYEVTMLDDAASVLLTTSILNRQDADDERHHGRQAGIAGFDPRRAESFAGRVLQPAVQRQDGDRDVLGYRTTNSGMTIAVATDTRVDTDDRCERSAVIADDVADRSYRIRALPGRTVRLVKTVSYHTSRAVPPRELADRCGRTLDRARDLGTAAVLDAQRAWLDDYWNRTDVVVDGPTGIQQAVRWNLFQLAQATARTDGQGIAAKGVSGSGYGGHYFWDTEVFVLPHLTYTSPQVARNALRFRYGMLDAARNRAIELNQRGALFPWRTINGLESSAYYAAGTAQYHIDADVSHALVQYVRATGDQEFLDRGAVDILVETARLWADLGFWRSGDEPSFHIDGVTGPDEYTAVVDDNLYTNVMAQANLREAVAVVSAMQSASPVAHRRMVDRLRLSEDEVTQWLRAADAMHIPYDEVRGIHAQDAQFLDKELWDLDATPLSKRPLLLHFHPLVIYRFQVLKQADVVLALFLHGDRFTAEQKRRDFEYYEALTTSDSTLSGVVQSIVAAEVGHHDLAHEHFLSSLFVDLADLHHNTADGVHIASTGGVWSALVSGFGGFRDHGGRLSFDPRLPVGWERLAFRLTVRGRRVRVELTRTALTLTLETGDTQAPDSGETLELDVRGAVVTVTADHPTVVPLEHQGPLRTNVVPSASDLEGSVRADGSVVTASIPTIRTTADLAS